MSSILISSQPFTNTGAIASRVAELLDYRLVDAPLFQLTSKRFNVPEAKLREAFTRGPSLLGMSAATRKRLAAYLQATLSALLLEDRLIYHGPFAHALVTGVSHILRVRIVAPLEARCERAARQAGVSPRRVEHRVAAEDEHSQVIAQILFGKDVSDDGFDILVNAVPGKEDSAAKKIANAVSEKRYVPMTYSKRIMQEVELAHRLRSMLVDLDADASVQVVGHEVCVRAHASGAKRRKTEGVIEERLHGIEGIDRIQVQVFDQDLVLAGRR